MTGDWLARRLSAGLITFPASSRRLDATPALIDMRVDGMIEIDHGHRVRRGGRERSSTPTRSPKPGVDTRRPRNAQHVPFAKMLSKTLSGVLLSARSSCSACRIGTTLCLMYLARAQTGLPLRASLLLLSRTGEE
ncbi:hypothetical protein BD309DRAFT_553298 [Dichomitus squalens]|uniref:Uncharacterized protein n=1 Tax=Dichomitus squalens TaxID=114155 RepID=A0A4Q9PJ97_9APHY|nr:hypothetical protein BD309DRAFT_553298 [Dichomitus squalens]TBU54152.1 hypothetical protein BD310DRAFT_103717 [Dichomitus squalens]